MTSRDQAGGAENLSEQNRLLSLLPTPELTSLLSEAEVVSLERATPLIKPNEPIRDVWFPINCLASLVTILDDGSTVESGAVGREGMVGIPVILGAGATPMQTLIQVPGDAIRVKASHVKQLFDGGGTFRTLLNRYVHVLFIIASQSAACNRRHGMEERFARWLLTSSDGIGSERVAITHEFLAAMLGVRRSGVTETAQALQERGLIEYRRASVLILDRPGLERVACECYVVTRREHERLRA